MFFQKTLSMASLALFCASLGACKAGYNRIYENDIVIDESVRTCSKTPITTNTSPATLKVFNLISDLSCRQIKDYILSGQSLGNGNAINGTNPAYNYATLIDNLAQTGQSIAVINIDYENDNRYSLATLNEANETLIRHAQKSGIISISWTPLNPWSTNNTLAHSTDVKLTNLISNDPALSGQQAFTTQLNNVIQALRRLQENNIPVVFSPFPEMNTAKMWYGAQQANTDGDFKKLWDFVNQQFANAQLNNILWVYAPYTGLASEIKSTTWGYPGDNKIDIIAPISFSDELNISAYEEYVKFNKPMGMTHLAPKTANGKFDNRLYASQLNGRFTNISYWIAAHDDDSNGDGTIDILRSIYRNEKAAELFNDNSFIATTETIANKSWLINQ